MWIPCIILVTPCACTLGFVEARSGMTEDNPNSKVYGANMGPTWVLSAPDGPHVDPMNLAIREWFSLCRGFTLTGQSQKNGFLAWLIWPFEYQCCSYMVSIFPKRTKRRSHLPYVNNFLYPCFNEVERGYTGFTSSVRPSVRLSVWSSVCGQNVARSVSSTILAWSLSYLHILSNNFRRCVACKDYCMFPNLIFWHFLIFFVTLTLSCMTWDLIRIHSVNNQGAARGILRMQVFFLF